MRALVVTLAVLLTLASLPLALSHGHKTSRIVSTAAANEDGLPDGARCTLNANHQPIGLPCASSSFHCVVTRVPTPASAVFTGFCNSSYALGSHCMYTSQPYAVGTQGIKGNPACARCTCTNHPEKAQEVAAVAAAAADYAASINSIEGWRLAGTRGGAGGRSGVGSLIGVNTAECDCEDVGPCYVDWQGDLVKGPKGNGIICPETRRCMIHTVGGGGQDNDGRPVDQGTCEGFGEEAVCVAAGKSWGPKFYVEGTDGVPGPRGRCEQCTCGENGALLACNQLLTAMEGQQANEDTPQAGSDEPPLPPKATEPRSGLDFLRGSAAPVTPDPPRSTVDDSAVKDTPTATPEESPREAAFTIPPAIASCSKDPQSTAPSPTPSTVRVSVGPPSATSTPKRARSGKWAQHTLLVGGRRLSASNTPADPPPAASAPPEEDVFPIRAYTGSPALTKAQLREQMFLEASIMYDTRWSGQFSWLVFGKIKDGFPYVKCSVCMAYGKENTRYARHGDDGGRDMQTQAFRAHEHTDAHKAVVDRQLKIARGIREGKQVISNFINSDVEGRRAMDHINSSPFLGLQCDESTDRTSGKHMIVYLTFIKDRRVVTEFFTLLTVEKCDDASLFEVLMNHLRSAAVDVSKLVGISTDGASVMTGKDNRLVARIRVHALHLFSCHCIAHREALAVKDAATSNPDLGMVDKVVRTVAAKLGDSLVWSQRFKYLQCVIYNSNLEVQGIHTVCWLSRGDAMRRLCKVLGACIVLLWERSHKVYEIVTCYKFQFCVFSLADILADMNDLNRCFQKRDIDVTEIAKQELIQILLLNYDIEWPDALEVWRSMRRRRPAKSMKLAVADRERRGKAKEGEVEAGAAHQNDGEEDEEEEVDVEQALGLGDDQELVGEEEEEEDNPFLSDDEDVEEVFHIDRPVH
ncbi:unnamed protein product [Closterium sp. NIES-54]